MDQIFANLDADLFQTYALWSVILVFKMFFLMLWTGRMRFKNRAFINPEDVKPYGPDVETTSYDPEVERVRRAHLNDLENIPSFFVVAFLYLLTGPNPVAAGILIRLAAIARIVHSIVYAVYPLPQPARALSFLVCFFVTIYMAVECVIFYYKGI